MGLLDKLWDDTVAGPPPDKGLGKLRKHSTFSSRSVKESDGTSGGSYGEELPAEPMGVTRSIMIIRSSSLNQAAENGSPPISPAGSTPPVSPFSGSREMQKFRRRSTSDAFEKSRALGGPRNVRSPFDV